jgi:cystathionine beta-lyase/cystathionine gamma-synthase
LSFELEGGVAAAEKFIAHATIPISAPSLGGVETLVTRPAATSHSGMTPENRAQAGISDALVRLSVGLESSDDLIEDLTQAMRSI